MSIQDLIFTLGGIFFIISLIPAMRNPSTAIPLGSSLATGMVLWAFSATSLSLGLVGGCITNFITGSCWLFLAAFRRTPTSSIKTGSTS